MDTWHMIQTERGSLVDALDDLADTDWDQPSLCSGWTVRQVVGHIIATATVTPPRFVAKLAASGFNFPAMVGKDIARITAARTNPELVELLRARIDARTAPPGPVTSWLGETIVHGEDIFRALGAYRDHPVEHLVAIADFYSGSNLLIGAKNRISGLTVRATDTDWRHGAGPEVSGPLVALVLAMTGRAAALDDLTGPGVAVLRGRH